MSPTARSFLAHQQPARQIDHHCLLIDELSGPSIYVSGDSLRWGLASTTHPILLPCVYEQNDDRHLGQDSARLQLLNDNTTEKI